MITFRPIDRWPRAFTKYRRRSPFSAKYAATITLLEREISLADGMSAVVQLATRDFRVSDGKPHANAFCEHPGVIVSFEKSKTPISFPCDAFLTWIENLRAVALALEAPRKVDRYGVTKHGEQYRGWNALPPAIVTPQAMTVEQAAHFVAHQIGINGNVSCYMLDMETYRAAYREAAKRWHPDRDGVQHPEWNQLQAAKEVLDRHFGV